MNDISRTLLERHLRTLEAARETALAAVRKAEEEAHYAQAYVTEYEKQIAELKEDLRNAQS